LVVGVVLAKAACPHQLQGRLRIECGLVPS
jgi:hypothetical protein